MHSCSFGHLAALGTAHSPSTIEFHNNYDSVYIRLQLLTNIGYVPVELSIRGGSPKGDVVVSALNIIIIII